MNRYLLKSTIVAALGGLLFGFDTVVISGATSTLSEVYQLTPMLLGFTVASALLGTVLGSMFAGAPSDRYGRRQCLQALAVLYVITALGCALAWNWSAFVWFRFIGGLAIGGSSVIGPMYIAEIAPAAKRGRLVGLFQFNIVAGILIAYLSNYVIGTLGFGAEEWRWKLGVAILPAVFFFVTLFGIPQSPRWLIRRGFIEEARQIFTRIGEPDPDREVADVIRSVKTEDRTRVEPLFQHKYRRPIMLAIAIGFFNQMSGINAILYYLNDIFKSAGFDKVSSDLQAVAIGATNLLFTIVAMSVIDRLGRKKLLLTGAAGTAVCLAGVAVVFFSGQGEQFLVWLLIGFIGFFAFSQGAVIWVYLSEVFPNLVRAKGQSLGSFTHWIMNAIIAFTFPLVATLSRPAPFVFFAVMTVVQFIVVLLVFPETAGITLEDMQEKMEAKGQAHLTPQQFHFQRDRDLVAHQQAARLERHVPHQAEILPIDLRNRGRSRLHIAPGVFHFWRRPFDSQRDLPRHSVNRQVPNHLPLAIRPCDLLRNERDLRILFHVQKVGALQVRVALFVPCVYAGRVNVRLHPRVLRRVRIDYHGAADLREFAPDIGHHHVPYLEPRRRMRRVDRISDCLTHV